MVKVSLFASAVRPKLWPALFQSLIGTSVDYEVVFAGNVAPPIDALNPNLKWIQTENIKPAQCYEIARRECTGETVIWIADDCLFPDDVIGKAYQYWVSQKNEKLILSLLTHERYEKDFFITNLNVHTLRGNGSPLMAPIGLMSRLYLDKLGGYDARYCCGQSENDVVMRIYQDGGQLQKFEQSPVIIDHYTGHGGVTTVEGYARPFGKGYPHDRRILEGSWIKQGSVSRKRLDEFQPFIDDGTLVLRSQFPFGEYWI